MSSFQPHERLAPVAASSIHTVEGNVAGARAAQLERKRLQDLEEFEQRKRQIHDESSTSIRPMSQKFAPASTAKEEVDFRNQTIGLVSASDFAKKAASVSSAAASLANKKTKHFNEDETSSGDQQLTEEERAKQLKAEKRARKLRLKEKKKMLSTLSFANEEDLAQDVDDDDKNDSNAPPASLSSTKRVQKDASVDTSFLPDAERDQRAMKERQRLEEEWHAQQELVKQEKLEIIYSYWDGSGHRRSVTVRKGDSIGDFLELVRKDLCREFRELVNVSSDALLYVKEDLIIPSDLTFYDLILTKARGKSGPLFHFDVHDDVRVGAIDARIEKDESHPGKVVERRWYDRNKHIFPASRWEVYDPAVDYGGYTIGDRKASRK